MIAGFFGAFVINSLPFGISVSQAATDIRIRISEQRMQISGAVSTFRPISTARHSDLRPSLTSHPYSLKREHHSGTYTGEVRRIDFQNVVQRITFENFTLAPLEFVRFCIRYSDECRSHRVYRGGPLRLDSKRWGELNDVNFSVNQSITPKRKELGFAGGGWVIAPDSGDCNDYAVTKRHQLLAMGWPARVLLLSEVVIPDGEHHLVLVVRTDRGELVLDNLTPHVKSWLQTPYKWLRIQMPSHPRFWADLRGQSA